MSVRTPASHLARDTWASTFAIVLSLLTFLGGCATAPSTPHSGDTPQLASAVPYRFGEEVVVRAMAQIGTPYRYGGADLGGFDCSGLVFHVYRELGVATPRTAAAQFEASDRLSRSELRPGDLVFFRTSGRRISHVGIYAGEGRFVHAPQTGRNVELRSLEDDFYAATYAGGGRLGRSGPGVASAP